MTCSPAFLLLICPVSVTASPNVICGCEVPNETAGGAPATRTVPVTVGLSASRYRYVPATSKVNEYVRFGARTGEAKVPVAETTWWFRVSTLRHLTVSPATMLTVWGEKALRLMSTGFVAASASGPAKSADTRTERIRMRLMVTSFPRRRALTLGEEQN